MSFQAFLYKNKLNSKTLIEISSLLCDNTKNLIIKDLSKEHKEINYIFTDGGCHNNGKSNAEAAWSIYFPNMNQFNKTEILKTSEPTNQKAELTAIMNVYKIMYKNKDIFNKYNNCIVTDSMYSINCIDKWSGNWINNNFKTTTNKEVKNKDLIKKILEYRSAIDFNVFFKHINSHTKEPDNKNTKEYLLWNGNKIVDDNITSVL